MRVGKSRTESFVGEEEVGGSGGPSEVLPANKVPSKDKEWRKWGGG